MDRKPPPNKPLALEPMEASTPESDPARTTSGDAAGQTKAPRDLQLRTSDEFLAKATKEYQEGQVDQALWRRAVEQCGQDESLVIAAYLRFRATALQLKHKLDERSPIQARGGGSRRGASSEATESNPQPAIPSTKFTGVRHRDVRSKLLYLAAAGVALTAAVAGVYVMVLPDESVSKARPVVAASAPSRLPGNEQPVAKKPGADALPGAPEPAFAAKVQQLKSVGKWNVLVLNATEWARQEPNNATAWTELSVGFAKLQQFNDALDAATKAVQLAPRSVLAWRNLGQINLAIDRLPEAGVAFDKALALNPDDAGARCEAALVAQRSARPPDAAAQSRRVKTDDGGCPDANFAEDTAAPAVGSAPSKPSSSAGH
jgi:tetratricopeptide (TPR) repeat protein